MSVLFMPRRTVVRKVPSILGHLGMVAALLFLGATLYAALVPVWTEAGLRAELDRAFRPGATGAEVDYWFTAHRAISHPLHNADVHGLIYAGPIADRERSKFRVVVHLDRDRVTGYDLTVDVR